jgi:hypothetical protein
MTRCIVGDTSVLIHSATRSPAVRKQSLREEVYKDAGEATEQVGQ